MKIVQRIMDYCTLSRSELRGALILIGILFALIIVRLLIPDETAIADSDFPVFYREIQAFEEHVGSYQSAAVGTYEKDPNSEAITFVRSETQDSVLKSHRPTGTLLMIELNSADTLDLQRLNGIGPAFARRITAYRNRLGGFLWKSQLLEVWGMDSSRYQKLFFSVSVDSTLVKKMDVNTVTFKEMIHHPYMPYELAKSIIVYRQKQRRFQSIEEVRTLESCNESLFRKLSGYLSAGN